LPELLKKEAQSNKDTLPSQKRHPLLKELQHIDTNTLTPLEALNTLNQWKEKWGNNG
jgi:DNA mismatch repair ATPase MutS